MRLPYFFVITAGLLVSSLAFAFPKWEKAAAGTGADSFISLVAHPLFPEQVIAASSTRIAEQSDTNEWRSLWIQTGSGQITKLISFSSVPATLFVLTEGSILRGNLLDHSFRSVYRVKNSRNEKVLSFTVLPEDPSHWFAGTTAGLFESDDAGRSWLPVPLPFAGAIHTLHFSGSILYAADQESLYATEDLIHFRQIFSLASQTVFDADLDEMTPDTTQTENAFGSQIHEILSRENNKIWIGTARGVFESSDGGKTWTPLPQSGLRSAEIRHLIYSATTNRLYAGTLRGLYAFDFKSKTWDELFQGLDNSSIQSLAILYGDPPTLLAVTESGISKLPLTIDGISTTPAWQLTEEKSGLFKKLIALEPTVRKVQQDVIRYNDLQNSKIKRWHTESRLKSLLPDISFGRDESRSNSIDLDRGTTSDADVYITGPPSEDFNWDLNVGWNLGDLVYSSDQTSIDNRGKLMVDLRHDLLGEATRIYYERRRLQMETFFSPAESEQFHYERLMRLDELTALLDGMTGGKFGETIMNISEKHPELDGLWVFQPI